MSVFCCSNFATLPLRAVILCVRVVPSPCIWWLISSAWCARIFIDSCILVSTGDSCCVGDCLVVSCLGCVSCVTCPSVICPVIVSLGIVICPVV